MAGLVLKWAVIVLGIGVWQGSAEPQVWSVTPSNIGLGGGAITIEGAEFSEDVFNQFDPVLGNKVSFCNELQCVSCQTPINWNFLLENPQDPSTTKVVCDLPPRVGNVGSEYYKLKMTVDGFEIKTDKQLRYAHWETPLIRGVSPRSGKVGDLVTLTGRFFTKEYGNANFGDQGTVNNRREESVTAVMMGSRECELTDELGNVHGLSLDSPDSNEGQMACVPGGTMMGPVNSTVFISGSKGKSLADEHGDAYSVNSKGQLFMYQMLPAVTSISANTGASSGGLQLKIKGSSFDAMAGQTVVDIGGAPCEIIKIDSDELTCSVPAESDIDADNKAGGRGLKYEIWTDTETDLASVSTLPESADYVSWVLDGSTVEGPYVNETNGFSARLSGYFVAPYTGAISFYLSSSDAAKLYLSTSTDPADKQEIVSNDGKTGIGAAGSPQSDPIMMEKDNLYYIEAVHVQKSSSEEENHLQISIWQDETIYHEYQTPLAKDEVQTFSMYHSRVFETQEITFNGVPEDAELYMTQDGLNSRNPISLSMKDSFQATIKDMLVYSCNYPSSRYPIQAEFEEDKLLDGQGGTIKANIQAYCGDKALVNQQRIRHSYAEEVSHVNAQKTPWLCFAAKGTTYNGVVQLLVNWVDKNMNMRRNWMWIPDVWVPSDDWSHQCVNMYDSAFNPNITWFEPLENSKIDVEDILLQKGKGNGDDYFMDSITISQTEVEIERFTPALDPNKNILVSDVAVEETSANTFAVSITPWSCNTEEEDFTLFGFKDAEIEGLDVTGLSPQEKWEKEQEYLRTSDSATFTSSSWGGGSITVTRTVRGTRALQGTFDLSYKGKTITLDPYPTTKSLASALVAFGMAGVNVKVKEENCYNLKLSIELDYALGGNIDEITMDASNLITDGDSEITKAEIKTRTDGGIMVKDLTGDFFRMMADQTSINVYVNGFLSSCDGIDCSFSYDSSLTPKVNSVSGSNSADTIVLTISGENFSEELEDNIVSVGELGCSVIESTTSEIKCELEAGPAGTYEVSVVVASAGDAVAVGGPHTYELSMSVFSIDPKKGSLGGGTPVTVSGSGFPNTMDGWKDGNVTMGEYPCTVTETSYDSFVCTTSAGKGSKNKVTITLNGKTVMGAKYAYSGNMTPKIDSLSHTMSTPMGGEELIISGTALGNSWGKVKIGESFCDIVKWFDTEIICILPGNPHGSYPVVVEVKGNGFADASAVSEISYAFKVTNMTPRKGSLMGGTKMTISGEGFANCTNDVNIMLGENYDCKILDCTENEIICETRRIPKNHQITNGCRHPKLGIGYCFQPSNPEVQPGDTVTWTWKYETDTQASVHQVASAAINEYDGSGFKSEASSKGNFRWTCHSVGTYYYSSVPQDNGNNFMKGSIECVNVIEEGDQTLKVMMNSIEAVHEINEESVVEDESCPFNSGAECAEDPIIVDVYAFKTAKSCTPSVTSIAATSFTSHDNKTDFAVHNGAMFTIEGSGFAANMCENKIMIGGSNCVITANSESSLECTLDGSDVDLKSLKDYNLELQTKTGTSVKELGSDNFDVRPVPKVDSITPNQGSWAGGTMLNIDGTFMIPYGEMESIFVSFGDLRLDCKIVENTFTSIKCIVPDFSSYKGAQVEKTVDVTISMGYDSFDPLTEPFQYTFNDESTSTVSVIDKTEVSASELVTVTGTKLDGEDIKVYLAVKKTMRRRKRSLIVKRDTTIIEDDEDKPKSPFAEVMWKSKDGYKNNDDVTGRIDSGETSERFKRSTEDDEENNRISEQFDFDQHIEKCMDGPDYWCQIPMPTQSRQLSKRSSDDDDLYEEILGELYPATIESKSEDAITFEVPKTPAGTYEVVLLNSQGMALGKLELTSSITLDSIESNSGSVNGGQLITISGSGFCEDSVTTVMIDSVECAVQSVSVEAVTCITGAGTDGEKDLTVQSCSLTVSGKYTYSDAISPSLDDVSPSTISGAETLTLTGSNFGSSHTVMVGENECSITSGSETSIKCDIVALPGGQYDVVVKNMDTGLSNSFAIESVLNIGDVQPSEGSFGGGSEITITGAGFDDPSNLEVKLCDNLCDIVEATSTEIKCLTPANDDSGATKSCDLSVSQPSGSVDSNGAFTYDKSLTPTVSMVSPKRGGTGGGTPITITGTGFADSGNEVTIDGSICDITAESSTEIQCITNHHNGAIEITVTVDVPDMGYATYDNEDDALFYYIDRWSSIWTWGGLGTPLEGEYIVIDNGQEILLDVSTPTLKFLLIKGGTLMFDNEQALIDLNTEYILLVEGGKLQIGTEDEPYESKAIITMHGNVRCTELPIFGCKVIGVRNGTLDFHGSYVPVTWTHLAETAPAESTEITLKQPVTWKVGDEIAIATTSDRNSMKENERHTIAAISDDGYTITLEEPLKYQHISISQTFGDIEVETRGEVGLLTRNVLIRGTMNEQFVETLPACEQEFNSGGAFSDAMQTCFAGKFGEELGSDEMGAVIIISPKYKDQGLVEARIEYTEFTSVGQAFRVGRYPIHFHLPGNMNTSYIRGNAIHHSNNRACTLHDVANLVVEHNVAYNIKGLSFFLEDGVEEYNTLQYNLAIFTKMSNSLLNPDINPASFWIVNPNNKFRHNSCAGGTHFCFWLRAAKIPDGPSFTRNYCPNKVPFDEFHNNTAHSMGWYGFWIFGQSNHATYDPHDGDISTGYCQGKRIQTTIGSFTTWNNKRGFEIVTGANIRLENQIHMDHDFAGFEIFTSKGPYGEEGPGIFNSLVVGHSDITAMTRSNKEEQCTPGGIHITDGGYTIRNVTFANFDRDCYGMRVRLEEFGASALAARVEDLKFINTPNKVFLEPGEEQGLWMLDVDGSLTGTPEGVLVGHSDTNPSSCKKDSSDGLGVSTTMGGHPGAVCPAGTKFHRMKMVGEYSPTALKFNALDLVNDNGKSSRPWTTMLEGWEALLPEAGINWMTFNSSEQVTNISYHISFSDFEKNEGNYLLIGHKLYQQPDRFVILNDAQVNSSVTLDSPPTYEDNVNGDWYFTNETGSDISELIYLVSDKDEDSRKKRAAEEGSDPSKIWIEGTFNVFKCELDGCVPKPPPELPGSRPENAFKWSNADDWAEFEATMPVEGDTVSIPPGAWMVMDVNPPPLKRIFVYGALEIDDSADRRLEVEIIMIQGGKFVAGTQDTPFTHNFDLVLTGNHFTEEIVLPSGPSLGAKALGVFGYLDMHGVDNGKSFVKIASDIDIGSTSITLAEEAAWSVGNEIVVSSTSHELHETEKRTIVDISGTTITVDTPFEFKHTSKEITLEDGTTLNMSGEVGLLSKNVRIVGNDYETIEEDMFGGRVLVGQFMQDGIPYYGFARFENVEFAVAGQDGWYDNYDPRYALAYLDNYESVDSAGAPNANESYVVKCSFNYNYNSAIGIFNSDNIRVEENVIYRFINNGIFDESYGTRIKNNLVTMGESVGRIKGQAGNTYFYGCINTVRGSNTSLYGNIAAGCAQAGIATMGTPCDEDLKMENNEVHSTMHGVHLDSYLTTRPESGCVQFGNIFAWKNYDYGVYTKSESSVEFDNVVSVDNGVGLLPYIYGPAADAHEYEDKYMTLKNSIIVGTSSAYDCSEEDVKPDIFENKMELKRRWVGRWLKADGVKSHHHGIIWPIFQSEYGKTKLAWHQPVVGAAGTYPALRGKLEISDVTFANFGEACGGKDIVFRTNIGEDDVNWPIMVSGIKLMSVNNDNKVYMDEPLAGKINPSDCTDFDCDGMKKAMIYDNDGSFSGAPGTIIPDSAFEWDGNPARGLGYYRVPKPMITELNGDRIAYEDKMPNTGIVRDDTCAWNSVWRSYKCEGIKHRMLIFESLDRDTKIRRLGPVAMLADAGQNGYIDLVNGPQDHSCCSGYICAERLSTFYTMVATGKEYEMMFSSIPPQKFRIHLLHNEDEEAVRLKIWFPKQQRLDVYVDGVYIRPNNIDMSSDEHNLLPPDDSYIPTLDEMNGANYFDPISGHLYVSVRGPSTIDVRTEPVVVLKFGGAVPIENFFEENVIGNIAGLLGIDPSKIRITNIVREGSVRKRRDGLGAVLSFTVTISNDPSPTSPPDLMSPENIDYASAPESEPPHPVYTTVGTTTTTTEWVAPANHLSFEDLNEALATVQNLQQTGKLSDELSMNIGDLTIEKPIQQPVKPAAYTSPEARSEITPLTHAEQSALNDTAQQEEYQPKSIEVPFTLRVAEEPQNVKEMEIIDPAVTIYAATENGQMIKDLGTETDPWECTVTILNGTNVEGTVTTYFEKGIALFDSMYITQAGDDYVLQFEVTYPTTASNVLPAYSKPFNVGRRPLGIAYPNDISMVPVGTTFSLELAIWDEALNSSADGSVLAGLDWECTVDLLQGENNGTLSGTLTKSVPTGENSVVFDDLEVDFTGMDYRIIATCSSEGYDDGSIVKTSLPFSVHEYPEMELLNETEIKFKFEGSIGQIQGVVEAFSNVTITTSGGGGEQVTIDLDSLKNVYWPKCIN